MTSDEVAHGFKLYCEDALTFQSANYIVAVHQDMVRGEIVLSNTPKTIHHKLEALRLLNCAVAKNASAETLLLGIAGLCYEEPAPDQLEQSPILLFHPHIPNICGIHVWGRTKTNASHTAAVRMLVARAGGLDRIGLRGVVKHLIG